MWARVWKCMYCFCSFFPSSFFSSKLLCGIALWLNLHSMLQFILRTSPWYCVVSHDYCTMLPVLFDSCNGSSKNHTCTHACARALSLTHTHTHTHKHTHTLTPSFYFSHTHTYTPGNVQYTCSVTDRHTKYHSIDTEQTLGGYSGVIQAFCSLANILIIPRFTWGRIMKLWMNEGRLLYMMNACFLNKLV